MNIFYINEFYVGKYKLALMFISGGGRISKQYREIVKGNKGAWKMFVVKAGRGAGKQDFTKITTVVRPYLLLLCSAGPLRVGCCLVTCCNIWEGSSYSPLHTRIEA